ncbi:hypothetical protein ACJJTC_014071 [Scirpophaga incertulas]
MAHYTFDQNVLEATFKGSEFYQMRCNDLFLTDLSTVENILCQGKKIRQQLKTLQAGQTLTIGSAQLKNGTPLVIKKGGPNINIGDDEYTLNRLTGMCAAYSVQQSSAFSPKCAMAIALGLDQLSKNNAGKTLAALLTENKAALPGKLAKFGVGGSRGVAELERALTVTQATEESSSTDGQLDANQEQHSSSSNVTMNEGFPPSSNSRTTLKRRRSSNPPELKKATEQMQDALKTMNTVLNKSAQKEDNMCDIYGKLIASKLKKYFSDIEQHEVMFELHELLTKKIRNSPQTYVLLRP